MGEILLTIGAIYSIGFAIFHVMFWKIFKWKTNLRSITRINRGIMQVLNLRLIYVFLFFAYVSFFQQKALLSTPLGEIVLIFISIFWLMRATEQLIFFDRKNSVSIALTITFAVGGGLYLIPVFC
ncbi:MAG: hypothetical protein K8S15_14865 [Candidatus Aegiribacteria sp.]|nr:hypothetical protein [Candidatus Aegiribacteria sp.]